MHISTRHSTLTAAFATIVGVRGHIPALTTPASATTITDAATTGLWPVADSTITPAPDMRAASSVIGYYPYPNESSGPAWRTASCPSGYTFATADSGYGACCNSPDCLYATACAGADFFGPSGVGGTCGKGNTCISYTVRWGTDSPISAFWLGCSVPPNPSVPETLWRTTWKFGTSTSTLPRPITTTTANGGDDSGIGNVDLPPGFQTPTIPSLPTGGPNWSLTTFPTLTLPTGVTNGGDIPGAAVRVDAMVALSQAPNAFMLLLVLIVVL